MAFAPTLQNPGDIIKAQDWNDAMDEVVRLETAKLDNTGGAITGSLTISGSLGVGSSTAPTRALTVRGTVGTFLNVIADNGAHEVLIGADNAGGILSTMTNHDLQLRAGGNVTRLTVKADGKVGVGTTAPGFMLDVADRLRVRQGPSGTAGMWFFQTTPNNDRAFIGMSDDTHVGLWGNTGIGWGLSMDTSSGALQLAGDLLLPKTSGGSAIFTNTTYNNEGAFFANNLKLSMASEGPFIIINQPPLSYEFVVGHTVTSGFINTGFITNFQKRFSVNQAGNVFIAGSLTAGGGKGGYVVDNFINAVGETLEQGDVVILGESEISHYYGVGNSIPIPEVNLTKQAYDTRVCGIVESVVGADSLPPMDAPGPMLTEEEYRLAEAKGQKGARLRKQIDEQAAAVAEHPLASLAASATAEQDSTHIQNGQLGKMVTLGAYAFCKVDASIAPIKVGDLLTTSPTKGHAQKVLEPEKAVGAIIGKALGSLDKGKGKIPVLVLLH